MRSFTFILLLSFSSIFAQKQVPFVGKLTYEVTSCDSLLKDKLQASKMIVFSNDTLIRIENNSSVVGVQTLIKHLKLNKSYLLINSPIGKIALQSNQLTQATDSLNYSFTKKRGTKKIAGLKAKKLTVHVKKINAYFDFYYVDKISSCYLNNFSSFPGLPVLYYLATPEGIFKYELKEIETHLPAKDMFGIPSEYKKMSFDAFINEIEALQNKESGPK
jgi:hypothetical protein